MTEDIFLSIDKHALALKEQVKKGVFELVSRELAATATRLEMGDIEDIVRRLSGLHCSDELATLLNNLRDAQKAFFRNKYLTDLQEAKRLEAELDKFLIERAAPKPQPQLF